MRLVRAFGWAALLMVMAASWAAAGMTAAVSIAPQAYLVERIAGQRAKVLVLVGPGRSPATYEPTPGQMAALSRARLYFRIGVPFEEAFLPKLRANLPGLPVVDLRQGIKLRQIEEHRHHERDKKAEAGHQSGLKDPHIWLSPRRVKIMAATIHRHLSRLDPQGRDLYRRNLARLLSDLEALDQKLAAMLAPLKGRTMLVFHPAYGYLAADYHLKQKAIESGGKEPGPRSLARIVHEAREQGAKAIFVQPQFDRSRAESIARAIGGRVVPLDPLARDYIKNMESMAAAIAAALR